MARPRCPGPSAQQVIAAAIATGSLEAAQVRSWRRRLAWSGLLPALSTGVVRTVGSGALMDIYPDRADRLDLRNSLALRWEIRATWDLARLVFDSRELRISHQAAKLVAERRRMIERVASLYFERCRHLAAGDADGDGSRALRVQELTAILDALTGGLVSLETRR